MISRFLSWLGFSVPAPKAKQRKRSNRPRSATAHLFEKKPVKPQSARSASADGDFNPYNTGKFDRSASWERISKTQR